MRSNTRKGWSPSCAAEIRHQGRHHHPVGSDHPRPQPSGFSQAWCKCILAHLLRDISSEHETRIPREREEKVFKHQAPATSVPIRASQPGGGTHRSPPARTKKRTIPSQNSSLSPSGGAGLVVDKVFRAHTIRSALHNPSHPRETGQRQTAAPADLFSASAARHSSSLSVQISVWPLTPTGDSGVRKDKSPPVALGSVRGSSAYTPPPLQRPAIAEVTHQLIQHRLHLFSRQEQQA